MVLFSDIYTGHCLSVEYHLSHTNQNYCFSSSLIAMSFNVSLMLFNSFALIGHPLILVTLIVVTNFIAYQYHKLHKAMFKFDRIQYEN